MNSEHDPILEADRLSVPYTLLKSARSQVEILHPHLGWILLTPQTLKDTLEAV